MSLANKQARADQLRGELSNLRVEKEAALHDGHAALVEAQLDAEIARLEAEKLQAQAEVVAVKSGGSVEEALAAMRAAAAEEQPDGLVDLTVPLETETNGPVAEQGTPVAEVLAMPVLNPNLNVASTDAPKADGE